MRRQTHKGAFVLVEGRSDVLRFKKFFSQDAMFVPCHGKSMLLTVVEQFHEVGFEGLIGLVDSDFDRILETIKSCESLCYSAHHDFDMDVICSGALDRYLNEVADLKKLGSYRDTSVVIKFLMELIHPISSLRYVNQKYSLGYKLDNLSHYNFCDGHSLDLDRLIDDVSQGKFNAINHRAELKRKILEACDVQRSLAQLTSGHDLCAAIGIGLRNRLGSRSVPQTLRTEVEKHLRLTYDRDDFENCVVKTFCENWQKENSKYRLLK